MKDFATKKKVSRKQAQTVKEYRITAFGYDLVIPAGSIVSNDTACGPDDNYRFWVGYHAEVKKQHGQASILGATPPLLLHDLSYRGINVPAEYCEPYPTREY